MIARLFCWLGFHDWLCIGRKVYKKLDPAAPNRTRPSVEDTTWKCSRCGLQRAEEC